MLVLAPMLVRPATTTWECRTTPSPSSTSPPTMQNGPILTVCANAAPGSTIAVGWICVIRWLASRVHQHRGIGRLGDELAADLRLADELPDAAAVALLRD